MIIMLLLPILSVLSFGRPLTAFPNSQKPELLLKREATNYTQKTGECDSPKCKGLKCQQHCWIQKHRGSKLVQNHKSMKEWFRTEEDMAANRTGLETYPNFRIFPRREKQHSEETCHQFANSRKWNPETMAGGGINVNMASKQNGVYPCEDVERKDDRYCYQRCLRGVEVPNYQTIDDTIGEFHIRKWPCDEIPKSTPFRTYVEGDPKKRPPYQKKPPQSSAKALVARDEKVMAPAKSELPESSTKVLEVRKKKKPSIMKS
jgi:hypothetical protein